MGEGGRETGGGEGGIGRELRRRVLALALRGMTRKIQIFCLICSPDFSPRTAVGESLFTVSPFPSCPLAFNPQHLMELFVSKMQL